MAAYHAVVKTRFAYDQRTNIFAEMIRNGNFRLDLVIAGNLRVERRASSRFLLCIPGPGCSKAE